MTNDVTLTITGYKARRYAKAAGLDKAVVETGKELTTKVSFMYRPDKRDPELDITIEAV